MRIRPLIFLSLALFLEGCSSYEVDFDCPAGKGLRCASLSTVNRHIDAGVLGGEEEVSPLEISLKKETFCKGEAACKDVVVPGSDVLFYRPPQRLSSGEVLPGRYARVKGAS